MLTLTLKLKMVKSQQCPARRILASLILATLWLHLSQGASVNLTVEGGVNLVDENCPAIVTLLCEGVDINQLRWRYNGVTSIVIYSSDDSPSQNQPSQTFPSVELVAISQSLVDPNRANFTSILTADLSRLQSDNVMEIECGDAATFQIEPVNVRIIERSRPRNPSISMVTTEYQSERLRSIQMQWRKSENVCPDSSLTFIIYQVNLTAERSISVDHNTCSNIFCNATFDDIDGDVGIIKLSLLATNEMGSSELIFYPYNINSSAQQYFVPQVSFTNNLFQVECISTALSTSGQTCTVRYTTDPLFNGLSDEITSMLDTPINIPGLITNTTYYFEFSLLVNNSLQVSDRISFTAQTSTALPDWGIALIVIAVIVFGISTVVIFALIVLLIVRKKRENVDVLFKDDPAHCSLVRKFMGCFCDDCVSRPSENISQHSEEVVPNPVDQTASVTRTVYSGGNLKKDVAMKDVSFETNF